MIGVATSKVIFAKLDPGFFMNRKILRAGRNGRDVFLAILCINAGRGAQGWIPTADIEPWYLARYLGISEVDASDGVTKAVTAELIAIDDHAVQIIGWDQDWSRRALTRSEIQKAYRERKQGVNGERYHDVVTRDCDVTALPIRGEERRGERDASNASGSLSRDSDPDSDPSSSSQVWSGAQSREPQLRRRGRSSERDASQSLPSDWRPSPEATELARELELDLSHEAAQFVDYARAKGLVALDWNASFRKWLRQSRDRGKKPSKRQKSGAYTTKSPPTRTTVMPGMTVDDGDDKPAEGT